MKNIKLGHVYEVDNIENGIQRIIFIDKEVNTSGNFVTITDGTTNEEILSVLIDRISYLQSLNPCRENAIVITKLEESLMWLNKRTADRILRKVEGTDNS